MPLLEISNLRKIYHSPEGEMLTVLDVQEFALEAKQQLALRGSSGSGKTTLLNCIAGILSPDGGRIELAGHNMAALGEGARDRVRAETIGYIFQTFNLLQGYTCLENVLLGMRFGKGADRAFALDLLEQVGLGSRLNYRPGQLSVGQQQRVAVARALANQPKLVLADEPTGNLDPRNAREAINLVREICGENEAALLLVSHDQAVLDQFDDCADLADINHAMQEAEA
ncbi:MAG: ABC transporter ATP-binding protein [Verrucomicrobiota bacterium]|jgi:putative ABC transport system ATP-binding protein|nr:ABC transporter ATP-binding protein [Verrucomicrobiota bacterium]